MFLRILRDAVDFLEIPFKYNGNGRPPADLKDILKALCIKTYNNYSSWRVESELRLAKAMGIIDIVYKRSALNKYMESKQTTQYLHKLYQLIAQPMAEVETNFGADATGLSTFFRKRWVEVRDKKILHKDYVKLHIISGIKSNIITSARISEGRRHDSPYFIELLEETSKHFNLKQVVADAGYLSRKNCEAVAKVGATPFIMPKKNTRSLNLGSGTAWGRMIRLWKNNRDLFAYHYHQRSNVESTFGMLKAKFGHYIRAKLPIAQENEILTKIVCHNAVVLTQALLQFGLEPNFMVT